MRMTLCCPPEHPSMLLREFRPLCHHLRHIPRPTTAARDNFPPAVVVNLASQAWGTQSSAKFLRCQREQQFVTCALPQQSNDADNADVKRLQRALIWEANNQYVNVKGQQQTFDNFASSQFFQLQQQLPMPLQKSACTKLVTSFQVYEKLSHHQRADLVQSASNCLSAWTAHPSMLAQQPSMQDQGLTSPSPAEQQQLDDRRQPDLFASTSAQTPSPTRAASAKLRESSTDDSKLHRDTQTHSPQPQQGNAATQHWLKQGMVQGGHTMDHGVATSQAYQLDDPRPDLGAAAVKALGDDPAGPLNSGLLSPTTAESSAASSMSADSMQHDDLQNPSVSATQHLMQYPDNPSELTEATSLTSDQSTQSQPSTQESDQVFSSSTEQSSSLHGSSDASVDEHDAAGIFQQAKKVVNPETLAFRANFAHAAAAAAESAGSKVELKAGEQRSPEWFALRQGRLTASTFANALGMFSGGREALWEEKLGLAPKFAGNAATAWGTSREADALLRYEEITGQSIEECSFKALRDDEVHGWLGASPDGLVQGLGLQEAQVSAVAGVGSGVTAGLGAGVLEVKCPFNKGNPNGAAPLKLAQWYYMPQVQGLMDVLDRDWCNLFVWTVNGSTVFHIKRDREYWRLCFQALAEFWWSHVVPAKHALAGDNPELADVYRPEVAHPTTSQITQLSKKMAKAALTTSFPPANLRPQLVQRTKAPISM